MAPALATRWALAAAAVIALLGVAAVVGSRVLGLPAQLAADKQGTVSLSGPSASPAGGAALAANGTLEALGPPLLLYCNVTSPCTICAPSNECAGFRCACLPTPAPPPAGSASSGCRLAEVRCGADTAQMTAADATWAVHRQQLLCHVDAANSSSPVQHQVTRELTQEGQRAGAGATFTSYHDCEGSDAGELSLSSFESGMLCILMIALPVILYRKRTGRALPLPL